MTYRAPVGAAGNLTTFQIPWPTVADGDEAFVFFAHANTAVIQSVSDGLTSRASILEGGLAVEIYTRPMLATDAGANLTIVTSGAVPSKCALNGAIFSGVKASDPMPNPIIEHDNTATRTSPAATLTVTADVLVYMAERLGTATTTAITNPAGTTAAGPAQLNLAGSAPCNGALAYVPAAAALSTVGPYAWTVAGATLARRLGATIPINPSGAAPGVKFEQFLDSTGTLVTVTRRQQNVDGAWVDINSWDKL